MIRVLHVVTHMNRGGLETMIMNYYRNIDREKLQFDFLVHRMNRADYDDEIEKLGGKIHRLPVLNPFDAKYKKSLDDFFKAHQEYMIVHCHLDCLSAIPLRAAKEAGIPFCIAHSHNTSQDHNLKYLIKLFYKRQIPKYADKLFACSREAGDWMFAGKPYEVMANAIDAGKFTFSKETASMKRKEFGILEDELVVGHVGRFNRQKNHSFLIDIFQKLHERHSGSKLLLVGVGDDMDMIRAKVMEKKLESAVIFAGLRSDIPALLSAMDLFLFPSLYEGLPVTLIEAQAAGLPCFISDKVPIESKKTDLVKQLSLDDSPEKWAEIILGSDFENRKNTFEEIKRAGFDIKQNACDLQRFYESIVEGKKNPCLH